MEREQERRANCEEDSKTAKTCPAIFSVNSIALFRRGPVEYNRFQREQQRLRSEQAIREKEKEREEQRLIEEQEKGIERERAAESLKEEATVKKQETYPDDFICQFLSQFSTP